MWLKIFLNLKPKMWLKIILKLKPKSLKNKYCKQFRYNTHTLSYNTNKILIHSHCFLKNFGRRNNFVTQIQDNLYGLSLYDAKVCNSNETSYHNICMFNVIHKWICLTIWFVWDSFIFYQNYAVGLCYDLLKMVL